MYEWRDHTAEVELVVEAPTPAAVFSEAAEAFGRYVELDSGGDRARRDVNVTGRDYATLLVVLLEELIYLADTEGFVPDRAAVRLTDGELQAELDGRRTKIQPIVKAATYHDLEFSQADGLWKARVVLDV